GRHFKWILASQDLMESPVVELALLIVGGLAAGALGGLLGIGGGIILMPILRFAIGLPAPQAAGACIVAVFFTTLGGGYRHYRLGHIVVRSVMPVMLAGLVACAGCSLLFPLLARRGGWLDLGIGLVFLSISVRMLVESIPGLVSWSREAPQHARVEGGLPQKLSIGAVSGALPGLLGIGTGGILVPAFAFLLKTPIKTAMAASLVCFCCNAGVSAAFKYTQGYVDLHVALPLSLGTLVGANLGAIINRRFPSPALKLLFGFVFVCVSLRFILSSVK
ncbi:MAG: sulfite exporter TauE/SafE family protein, partial [Candidatus Eisenbacteria bacterium]|nr:sulfite exporter TauE/SafE family protein [Candidatus Eisenbacteria bacterium]